MTTTIPRLLTLKEVCTLAGVSRIAIYRWRRNGLFPQPVILGTRTIRWTEPAITKFLASRTAK